LVKGLKDPAGDEVFTMSVADDQQARMAAADTISLVGCRSLNGGMAKW